MNKSALTEQRRETVIGLLKNMNIRKNAEGGFDKDDVYECMQQLFDLYENNIEELENAYEGEINELRERYQKYDDNNELYVSLIMEAKKSSNEIINQAKTEVETILAEGRDQVAKQEKELEQMRNGMESEKEAITRELNASREAVEAEKAAMKAEVQAEKEKAEALKNKYKQQINAMEEEFAEIKTNILRTAGRVDSLKSKLADDEGSVWTVNDTPEAVDFPVMDEGVEEINVPDEQLPEIHMDEPAAAEIPAAPVEIQPEAAEETAPAAAAAVETGSEGETGGLRLEDLMPEHVTVEADSASASAAGAASVEDAQELKLEDIEVDLPELKDDKAEAAPGQAAAAVGDLPQEVAGNDEKAAEETGEISFEGLEELFKDEK